MCYGTAPKDFCTTAQEGTKYATARHKNILDCWATGRHKMCHSTAQNVPQHGRKILLDLKNDKRIENKNKNNKNNKAIIRAGRAALAAKN
jgi:hypothetical protein